MATFISHSPAETEALGAEWGRAAQPGLLIGLTGDLGAGKTQIVKGIARGLGITQRVTSPTFALINIYSGGRMELCHMDLYRLETREQVMAAGLEEYFQPQGVSVIEWAERYFDTTRTGPDGLPVKFRQVRIEPSGETDRRIVYEDFGA